MSGWVTTLAQPALPPYLAAVQICSFSERTVLYR